MDKLTRLARIIEAYERCRAKLESKGIGFGQTEGNGFWTATEWYHMVPFLEWAIKRSVISPSGPLVDAGSGTGEPSAFFSAYGFTPIVNIELSGKLVSAANEAIDALVSGGVVEGDIRTVHGDFTQNDAYKAAGIEFGDVRIFYHGINLGALEDLARKIRDESPHGTKLIVYGPFFDRCQEPKIPLRLEHRFTPPPQPQLGSGIRVPSLADFLVYSK